MVGIVPGEDENPAPAVPLCQPEDLRNPAEKTEYHGIIAFLRVDAVQIRTPGDYIGDASVAAVFLQDGSCIGMFFHCGNLPHMGCHGQREIPKPGSCIADVLILPQVGHHFVQQDLIVASVLRGIPHKTNHVVVPVFQFHGNTLILSGSRRPENR